MNPNLIQTTVVALLLSPAYAQNSDDDNCDNKCQSYGCMTFMGERFLTFAVAVIQQGKLISIRSPGDLLVVYCCICFNPLGPAKSPESLLDHSPKGPLHLQDFHLTNLTRIKSMHRLV